MRFEWDERKNIRNRAKHRVSFETATLVFEDPRVVSILDPMEENEERWHSIGMAAGTLLSWWYIYFAAREPTKSRELFPPAKRLRERE
jgi:uncharacterized DUF497 family protein